MNDFNYVGPAAPLKELESRTLPHGRFYKTDGGWMPSATTVVGHNTKAGISAWEKGRYTEAERVRRAASWRGTQYHTIVEHYLNNELEKVKESKGLPSTFSGLLVRLLIVFLTFTVLSSLFIVLSWGLLVVLIALLSLITL